MTAVHATLPTLAQADARDEQTLITSMSQLYSIPRTLFTSFLSYVSVLNTHRGDGLLLRSRFPQVQDPLLGARSPKLNRLLLTGASKKDEPLYILLEVLGLK